MGVVRNGLAACSCSSKHQCVGRLLVCYPLNGDKICLWPSVCLSSEMIFIDEQQVPHSLSYALLTAVECTQNHKQLQLWEGQNLIIYGVMIPESVNLQSTFHLNWSSRLSNPGIIGYFFSGGICHTKFIHALDLFCAMCHVIVGQKLRRLRP